jgi:hypothetical protein
MPLFKVEIIQPKKSFFGLARPKSHAMQLLSYLCTLFLANSFALSLWVVPQASITSPSWPMKRIESDLTAMVSLLPGGAGHAPATIRFPDLRSDAFP